MQQWVELGTCHSPLYRAPNEAEAPPPCSSSSSQLASRVERHIGTHPFATHSCAYFYVTCDVFCACLCVAE
eukprot:scaffold11028_cov93-Isochrysis_galbana.AAC.2